MGELKGCLEDALSGRGRLVTLVGEPGIGKTRTAQELATYAGLRGSQVLWGRCYEEQGAPPYWPWVQAIRSYVRDIEPEQLRSNMGAGAADIAKVQALRFHYCLPEKCRPAKAIGAGAGRPALGRPPVFALARICGSGIGQRPCDGHWNLPGRGSLPSAPTFSDAGRTDPGKVGLVLFLSQIEHGDYVGVANQMNSQKRGGGRQPEHW